MIEQLHEVVQQIEQQWSKLRLLVVGDVMLDKYIWGEVGRISPEAPVPIVRATHQSEQPGGAANVAMNISRLGASAVLVGFAGSDENGRTLDACLRKNGIQPALVESSGFPTITKLRILGGRQQMLRLDSERLGPRSPADYDRLLSSAMQHLGNVHAVVLSDYAKGVLSPEVCQELIGEARNRSIPIMVDPKCADFSRYRGATTVCPNLSELALALRDDSKDVDSMLRAAEAMVLAFQLDFLTATLSEKGIALIRPGNRFVAPAVARQVFDVSGAGDTVIAVLALALASGLRPETAVQLANVAAGIVVGKIGTVPVEKHELLAALAPEIALSSGEKVISREELIRRVAVWRANGERLAFTSGYFHPLSANDVSALEQARHAGDRLILGLQSNVSIATNGPTQAAVSEWERAKVLAALAVVDAVVILSEPTADELISLLGPDVVVKGSESWHEPVQVTPH